MDDREKQWRAERQVAAMTGFYVHLAVYLAVMTLLVVINVAYSTNWWVQWPMFGWGIGVAAHALMVFAVTPGFVRDWQRRKVDQLVDRM